MLEIVSAAPLNNCLDCDYQIKHTHTHTHLSTSDRMPYLAAWGDEGQLNASQEVKDQLQCMAGEKAR